jgi:hypothetical protein
MTISPEALWIKMLAYQFFFAYFPSKALWKKMLAYQFFPLTLRPKTTGKKTLAYQFFSDYFSTESHLKN